MQIKAVTWWIVFASLVVLGLALGLWLKLTGQPAAAKWVTLAFNIIGGLWLVVGLWKWREHPVVRRVGLVVIASAAAAIAVNIFFAFESTQWATVAAGMWALSVGFYLLLQAARLLLSPGQPVLGVARTLLDEAVRMKIVVALLVLLFLTVPIIPLLLDGEQRLAYRLKSFLTYSMIGTTTILSLVIITVAVSSLSREFEFRQIFMTMSKPVSRAQYLLGKWLGLSVLSALLTVICGLGIYIFAMLIAQQPANNEVDAREVREQVLVARQAISPRPEQPALLQDKYKQRLETLRQQDPQTYGQPNTSIDNVPDNIRSAVQREVIADWYALGPRSINTYVFSGLGPAKQLAESVQLRVKPKAAGAVPDDKVYVRLRVNDRDDREPYREMADNQYHLIEISTDAITEAGEIKLDMINLIMPGNREQPTITFNTTDGIQMLYRVDTFEANLARAMGLLWLRLCFLGMLALAAATFLSFPVAALLATMVCVAASGSAYLSDSIHQYSAFPKPDVTAWDKLLFFPQRIIGLFGEGEIWKAIKVIIALVGSGFMKLIPSFSEYSGTTALSFGLNVSWELLAKAALWVGAIWTGVVGLLAWLIFRRRELARVQV